VTPPANLVDVLFARSEGNPFFTEELVGVIRADPSALPATVRDLLRGRVQALLERARHVLEVVAVSGRRVPHRLLATVAGLDHQQLDGALRAAVASQLLVTAPGEDGYDVRHALLREVIDGDLLPGERTRLHAVLAHTLADLLGSGELDWSGSAGEIAVHWDRAGDLPKTLAWSVRAGVEADGLYAYTEALHHYGRALDLWDWVTDAKTHAGVDHVEVLQGAARAANACSDHDRALALIDQALREVDPAVDPVRAGLLHECRGVYLMVTRDLDSRFAALREAVRLIPADPPSKERTQVLTSYADALILAGRNDEARTASEEAVAIARQLGAERELSRALTLLGWAQATPGPFEAEVASRREVGLASLREACQLAEEYADPELLAHAYGWLGEILMEIGRLEDAVEVSLSGRDRVRRLGLAGYGPDSFLLANAVEALYKLGRWEEAIELANHALAKTRSPLASETPLPPLLAAAMVEVGRGEFPAAEAHLAAVKERSLAGVADLAREYTALLAELRLWQGRLQEARAAVQDGLDRVAGTDEQMRSGRLLCLGLRVEADQAELGRARHDPDDVNAAIRAANELGLPGRGHGTQPAGPRCHHHPDYPGSGSPLGGRALTVGRPVRPIPLAAGSHRLAGSWPALPRRLRTMATSRGAPGQQGAAGPGRRAAAGSPRAGGPAGGGTTAARAGAARPARPGTTAGGHRTITSHGGGAIGIRLPRVDRSRSGGTGARGGRAHQPPDRPSTVHHPQNRQRPRLKDPRQAGGRRPRRGCSDRSPAPPRQALIPPRPWRLSLPRLLGGIRSGRADPSVPRF
jgi:tetratricopeptide (TPR) repeat protein